MEKSFQRPALLVTLSLFFFIPASTSVPFLLFYGIGGECSNEQMSNLTKLLNNYSSSPGYCLEIGNGYQDSIYMPLTQQTSIACEKVKQMKELSEGYNIVAVSQGNLVARGVIEFCDNAPPVINYVSLGGPHAGVSGIPQVVYFFTLLDPGVGVTKGLQRSHSSSFCSKWFCQNPYCKVKTLFLSNPQIISNNINPSMDKTSSGFQDIKNYLENSKYLPKLNNERPGDRNSTFKDRFTSLHKLVLIMFESDNVLNPRESSWFGYYPDGAYTPILPPQKTKLYTEDWIGLKTLDDAGKVKFVSIPGAHIELPDDEVIKYVVPYLQNELSLSSERSPNHEAM